MTAYEAYAKFKEQLADMGKTEEELDPGVRLLILKNVKFLMLISGKQLELNEMCLSYSNILRAFQLVEQCGFHPLVVLKYDLPQNLLQSTMLLTNEIGEAMSAQPDYEKIFSTGKKANLDLSVDYLEFSVRTANCLQNNDVLYVGQLVQMSDEDLMKTRNFGKKCLKEVTSALESIGLTTGMDVAGWQPPQR